MVLYILDVVGFLPLAVLIDVETTQRLYVVLQFASGWTPMADCRTVVYWPCIPGYCK